MDSGLKIKLGRVKTNKRQNEFAKEVGISSQYLRRIESGKAKNPSKEIMERIAKALDATVGELFFDEN